jgi:hypothetical protein
VSSTPVKGMSRHLRDIDLVMAISTDNSFLHVTLLAEMVSHLHQHAEASEAVPSEAAAAHTHDERVVQFYDAQGYRLVPNLNPDLRLVGFTVDHDHQTDAEVLLARIDEALDAAQARLDADPDLGVQQSLPPATAVPRPTGSVAEVMDSLESEFGLHPGHGHRAGWFHNLFHV